MVNAVKTEADELNLLRRQLIAIGVPENSIISSYRFSRDNEYDLVVLNEGRKFPSMCFEVKAHRINEVPKSICRALSAGVRCYVVMPGREAGTTEIALLRNGNPIVPHGDWVDLSDIGNVKKLIPDYNVASRMVENLIDEKTQSERTRIADNLRTVACKIYVPAMLLLALIHIFIPPTRQHLILYGIITLVVLSVFGVRLVFQCKGFGILLDSRSDKEK